MDISHVAHAIAIAAIPVLFAITLHESAHGYVARHFGDVTAHAQGRISLNPLRHIDLVGTIVVPLVILLATGGRFLFGWAKPVPVNYSALRRPRQHMLWVAAAGPGSNLAMALGWALLLKLAIVLPDNGYTHVLATMSQIGVQVNLVLMFLNLLPILPLDGGRILASLLPQPAAARYSKLEPWGLALLLLLLVTNTLNVVLGTLVDASYTLIRHAVLF